MGTNKKEVKKVIKKGSKAPKLAVEKKVEAREPKFKLVTYKIHAIIPTGMYSNIQPEITVEAKTLEQAERAVMPHIEALFLKYRSDGTAGLNVRASEPVKVVVTPPSAPAQAQKPAEAPKATPQPTAEVKATPKAPEAPKAVAKAPEAPVAQPQAQAVMTAPFNRAKTAVESCASKEALKLVSNQITNSVKLTQEEKNTLIMMVTDKSAALDGAEKF